MPRMEVFFAAWLAAMAVFASCFFIGTFPEQTAFMRVAALVILAFVWWLAISFSVEAFKSKR